MRSPIYVWQEWPQLFRGFARVSYWIEHDRMSIEQSDDKTYFTDASGVQWRIHDVSFGPPHSKPHHYRKFAIGDARATSRVFVTAHNGRRSYAFAKSESRELSIERCTLQLARAGNLVRVADAHTGSHK
jgi:hypothetical protein